MSWGSGVLTRCWCLGLLPLSLLYNCLFFLAQRFLEEAICTHYLYFHKCHSLFWTLLILPQPLFWIYLSSHLILCRPLLLLPPIPNCQKQMFLFRCHQLEISATFLLVPGFLYLFKWKALQPSLKTPLLTFPQPAIQMVCHQLQISSLWGPVLLLCTWFSFYIIFCVSLCYTVSESLLLIALFSLSLSHL